MRHVLSTWLAFSLVVLLAACSSGPSDSDIKKALLSADGDDLMSRHMDIDELEKLAQYEQGGAYSIKLRFNLKMRTSSRDFEAAMQKKIKEIDSTGFFGMANSMQYRIMLASLQSQLGEWQPGAMLKIERELRFAKGDKGWVTVE